VDHSSSFGVAAILLTPEGECVLTDNIEASRIEEEQTPDMEVVEYPWHEDRTGAIKKLAGRTSVGADLRATDFRDVSDLVASLCHLLDPDALERYPKVGADASAALSEAAGALEPGTSEIEAAAKLIEACRQRGLFVPVALVGARGGSPATVTLLRPPPLWVGGR
jgi:Xaa-Pro aminopeptidase